MKKIVFSSPYPGFKKFAEKEIGKYGDIEFCFDREIKSGDDDVLYIGRERRGSGDFLFLEVSGIDLARSFSRCVEKGFVKVAVVLPEGRLESLDDVLPFFPSLSIECFTLSGNDERSVLESVREKGFDALLSFLRLEKTAKELSIPFVLIEVGKESLSSTLGKAQVILNEMERKRDARLILKYSREGVLIADGTGLVSFSNDNAEKMIGFHPVGRKLQEVFSSLDFERILSLDESLLGDVFFLYDKLMSLNVIRRGKEKVIVTFDPIDTLKEMREKITKKAGAKGFSVRYKFSDIIGSSEKIKRTIRLAKRFAKADEDVLIEAETGSGKELFAQSIHRESKRKNGPFVAVNCASIPENLLESELFGYVEGAFTGARRGGKVGLFELADGGTIFLDEVGDLPISLQARLLRVLQERTIMRLGSDNVTNLDVRVISATNKDLSKEVARGFFRSDLMYRLEVLKIYIPPLRERKEDIKLLLDYFLRRSHEEKGTSVLSLDKKALEHVLSLPWLGNVRELENYAVRLSVLTDGFVAHLSDSVEALGGVKEGISEGQFDERKMIELLLEKHKGSRKDVASEMGVDVSTLWRKMKKLGLC